VVDIVAVGSGWHVVDTSVPGWVTLERHSERWRAEAALERLGGQGGEAIEEGAGEAAEELERLLDGRVGVVRSRLSQVSSIAVLDRLEEMEASITRRVTVIRAITARRAELLVELQSPDI